LAVKGFLSTGGTNKTGSNLQAADFPAFVALLFVHSFPEGQMSPSGQTLHPFTTKD